MNNWFTGFTDEEIAEASRDMDIIRREVRVSMEENYPFYATIIAQVELWNRDVIDRFHGVSPDRIVYLLQQLLTRYNRAYPQYDPAGIGKSRDEIREMVNELGEGLEPEVYETVKSIKTLAMGVLALYARPNT